MIVVFSSEERLLIQHLGQYAACRPHVDCHGVVFRSQHYLGRAISPHANIPGIESLIVPDAGSRPGYTEATDLQITVSIEQQTRRPKVAMYNTSRVNGFEGAQNLVDEVLAVVVGEPLGVGYASHVCVLELLSEVDLSKSLVSGRSMNT